MQSNVRMFERMNDQYFSYRELHYCTVCIHWAPQCISEANAHRTQITPLLNDQQQHMYHKQTTYGIYNSNASAFRVEPRHLLLLSQTWLCSVFVLVILQSATGDTHTGIHSIMHATRFAVECVYNCRKMRVLFIFIRRIGYARYVQICAFGS